MLGLNEILHNQQKAALKYFQLAKTKATTPMQKNRSLLWQYFLSHDQQVLEELSQSTNIDLYTIYAHQKLNVNPSYKVVTDLGKLSDKAPKFDIKDPFQWQILKENLAQVKNEKDLKDLSKHFAYKDTRPLAIRLLGKMMKKKPLLMQLPNKKVCFCLHLFQLLTRSV